MIQAVLQKLVDEHRLSVREMSELTGRGESTVYRWLSGESQPAYRDIAHLVRKVSDAKAREQLLCVILAGLPVVVDWREDAERADELEPGSRDVSLRLGLRAIQNMVEALELQQATEARSDEGLSQTLQLLDEAIRNLTASKRWLMEQPSGGRVGGGEEASG